MAAVLGKTVQREGIIVTVRESWLAQTVEEPIDPDLPICDPHHHFWDFRTIRIP